MDEQDKRRLRRQLGMRNFVVFVPFVATVLPPVKKRIDQGLLDNEKT